MEDSDVKNLLEGRDIVLFYVIKTLEEFFAVKPELLATAFEKLLARELPQYSKQFIGDAIDPKEIKGPEDYEKAINLLNETFQKRKMHESITLESTSPTTLVSTVKGCAYSGFAKLCIEAGKKGCIFCPLTFAGQAISAATGVEGAKPDIEFDSDKDECKLTFELTIEYKA